MRFVFAVLVSLVFALPGLAQTTAFTYQGSLKNGGAAASGVHDFRFRLFDGATAGNQVGTPQCIDNLMVTEGLFSATLDFGQQFVSTAARYIEIEVRQDTGLGCANASGFVVLTPRQQITAAPLASHAKSAFSLDAANGSVPNAVFVDNAGRVGIGTLAPTHSVHIAAAEPTLALQDTGSATQQVGYISFRDSSSIERAWAGYGTPGSPHFSIRNARSGGNIEFGAASVGQLTVASNNNVGIGTTSPAAKLEVRGDIRLGASGQYRAAAGDENLRILRGAVYSLGTVSTGSGFTSVRLSEGRYRVTFDTPFSGLTTVTANVITGGSDPTKFVEILGQSNTAATFQVIQRSDGSIVDGMFNFIVVGPR